MNIKSVLSFLAGLLVSGAIYFAVANSIFISTFTFGSQTLDEKENSNALYFYSILTLVIITSIVIYKQFKLKRKALIFGISLSFLGLLAAFLLVSTVYFKDIFYYQSFDKDIWNSKKVKPFNMAKTLAKNNSLIKLTRKDIIEKLGYDKETAMVHGTALYFNTGTGYDLYIELEKDTVTKVYMGYLFD